MEVNRQLPRVDIGDFLYALSDGRLVNTLGLPNITWSICLHLQTRNSVSVIQVVQIGTWGLCDECQLQAYDHSLPVWSPTQTEAIAPGFHKQQIMKIAH